MLNLPNCITLFRIAMVVLFTVALSVGGSSAVGGVRLGVDVANGVASAGGRVALWAFVLGAASDFLDGYIARRFDMVTNLGKLLDPLADKILVGAAFIYLTHIGMCPFWVTILIIFREFLITGLRQLAADKGYIMAADQCGKWKTAFQLAYCIACLLALAYGSALPAPLAALVCGDLGSVVREALMWASVGLTLWSGLNYCIQGRHFLR